MNWLPGAAGSCYACGDLLVEIPLQRIYTKMKLACSVAMVGLFAVSVHTFAHHGTSAYDQQNRMDFKGKIAAFEWKNPHSQIHLDVADDKGRVVRWKFEAQPPNILTHAGWNRDSLKPGDQVTLVGSAAKNGAPIGIMQRIILANGQELTQTAK